MLQVQRTIEVVYDRALAAAGDHDHLLDPAGDRLLDSVLDRRLVDERQHLLRLRLGDRQESCPKTRGREDRLTNCVRRHKRQSKCWRRLTVSGPASKAAWSAWSRATSLP